MKKTKGWIVSRKETRPSVMKMKIDGYEIEADSFIYLEQLVQENSRCDEEDL